MSTTRPCSPGDRGPEPSDAPAAPEGGAPVAEASPVGAAAVASGAPGGRQVRRLSFAGAAAVVPLARDFARQALHAWAWLPADTADRRAAAEDVLLVVSELVTNACLHAEGPDDMVLSCDNKVIRVEVADRGTGQPPPHPAPRRPPRRPRHVHRPASLPGLGRRTDPGRRGQDGLGGTGRPGLTAPGPGNLLPGPNATSRTHRHLPSSCRLRVRFPAPLRAGRLPSRCRVPVRRRLLVHFCVSVRFGLRLHLCVSVRCGLRLHFCVLVRFQAPPRPGALPSSVAPSSVVLSSRGPFPLPAVRDHRPFRAGVAASQVRFRSAGPGRGVREIP